jgi:hypothetical protein
VGIPEGKTVSFDAAMAALSAINHQKTLSKVSIARPVTRLVLKAAQISQEALLPVLSDVLGATKVEHLDWELDSGAALNEFSVIAVEYGPDQKA